MRPHRSCRPGVCLPRRDGHLFWYPSDTRRIRGWVAERKDLLCALFFLLSIIIYTGDVEQVVLEQIRAMRKRGSLAGLLMTLGSFILALMSKPMAVTLPVVLLILDWYPFNRIRSSKPMDRIRLEAPHRTGCCSSLLRRGPVAGELLCP